MTWFFEWAPQVYSRHGTMINLEAMDGVLSLNDPGLRSVYCFDAEAAAEIRASRCSRGFNKYPVFSETLLVDFDDPTSSAMNRFLHYLRGNDISFIVYASGKKGFHVHAEIAPMFGHDVPFSQETFLRTLNIDCDFSIYRHSALIRNPGAIHPETGVRKTEVDRYEGEEKLRIELVKKPIMHHSTVRAPTTTIETFLIDLVTACTFEPKQGGRHNLLFQRALEGIACGLSHNTICELLEKVNSRWANQKSRDDVERAVQGAFQWRKA